MINIYPAELAILYERLYLLFDIESTKNANGKNVAYDIACQIIDKKGRVYYQNNWILSDVYKDDKVMRKAKLYKKNFVHYSDLLYSGKCVFTDTASFIQEWNSMLQIFQPNVVMAYGLENDFKTLENTFTHTKNKKETFLLPTLRYDAYHSCVAFICDTEEYYQYCIRNSKYTRSKKFISSRMCDVATFLELEEQIHTAIADTDLLRRILVKLWQQQENIEIKLKQTQVYETLTL